MTIIGLRTKQTTLKQCLERLYPEVPHRDNSCPWVPPARWAPAQPLPLICTWVPHKALAHSHPCPHSDKGGGSQQQQPENPGKIKEFNIQIKGTLTDSLWGKLFPSRRRLSFSALLSTDSCRDPGRAAQEWAPLQGSA